MATQKPTIHQRNTAKAVRATTCCAIRQAFGEAETPVCFASRVQVRILVKDYKLAGKHKAVNALMKTSSDALTKTNTLCYSFEN